MGDVVIGGINNTLHQDNGFRGLFIECAIAAGCLEKGETDTGIRSNLRIPESLEDLMKMFYEYVMLPVVTEA
jgi:hypothetical protein